MCLRLRPGQNEQAALPSQERQAGGTGGGARRAGLTAGGRQRRWRFETVGQHEVTKCSRESGQSPSPSWAPTETKPEGQNANLPRERVSAGCLPEHAPAGRPAQPPPHCDLPLPRCPSALIDLPALRRNQHCGQLFQAPLGTRLKNGHVGRETAGLTSLMMLLASLNFGFGQMHQRR